MNLPLSSLLVFVASVLALLALSMPSDTDVGAALLARGDHARARASFARALRDDPHDVRAWLGLGRTWEATGDGERHLTALELATRRVPSSRRLLRHLADAQLMERDLPGAARTLERLARDAGRHEGDVLERLHAVLAWLGRYDEAFDVARRLLARTPGDRAAAERAFETGRAANRQAEALALLEAWAARRPGDPEARRWLAEALRAAGETPGARAMLAVATTDRASGPATDRGGARRSADRSAAGRTATRDGASGDERAHLERAHRAAPGDEAILRRLVALHLGAGDGPRAVAAQRALVALAPAEPERLVVLADLLVSEDRAPEAVPLYERAVRLAPGRVDWLVALSRLYEWTGRPALALDALHAAWTLPPRDRGLGERVVALARALGEADRALAVLDRLIDQAPADAGLVEQAGALLVAAGRPAGALPYLRRVVELRPDDPAPALQLAQLLAWTDREPEAIAVYERLDRAGRLDDAGLRRLADLYRYQGRPRDFLAAAERLLPRAEDAELRGHAAEAAAGLGWPERALALLGPEVERRPGDASLVLRYLATAAEARRTAEGLRAYRRLLAYPGVSAAHRLEAARVLTGAGRHAEAIEEYRAILDSTRDRLDAGEALRARVALAQLYDWTDAPERALAEWQLIARARPGDARPLRHVARRALATGRTDVALGAYRALLEVVPDDAEALRRLGQLHVWRGDPRGARPFLERSARASGPDPDLHLALGDAYAGERDHERARAEYERALRSLPARGVGQ